MRTPASVPQALEMEWTSITMRSVSAWGLHVPMVLRITDEDLDAIQQRYHPEPGYDPAPSRSSRSSSAAGWTC